VGLGTIRFRNWRGFFCVFRDLKKWGVSTFEFLFEAMGRLSDPGDGPNTNHYRSGPEIGAVLTTVNQKKIKVRAELLKPKILLSPSSGEVAPAPILWEICYVYFRKKA